jgi:hypothetical protein
MFPGPEHPVQLAGDPLLSLGVGLDQPGMPGERVDPPLELGDPGPLPPHLTTQLEPFQGAEFPALEREQQRQHQNCDDDPAPRCHSG